MEIVRADPSHLGELIPLFDGYRQFYGQASNRSLAKSFLRARLDKGDAVIYLARDADTQAGRRPRGAPAGR